MWILKHKNKTHHSQTWTFWSQNLKNKLISEFSVLFSFIYSQCFLDIFWFIHNFYFRLYVDVYLPFQFPFNFFQFLLSFYTRTHAHTHTLAHTHTHTQDHLYRCVVHARLCGLAAISKATWWMKPSGLHVVRSLTTHTHTDTHTPVFCRFCWLYFNVFLSLEKVVRAPVSPVSTPSYWEQTSAACWP